MDQFARVAIKQETTITSSFSHFAARHRATMFPVSTVGCIYIRCDRRLLFGEYVPVNL